MKIVGATNNKLTIKEISYGVIFKAIILFIAALMITLNSGNNKTDSNLVIFLTGPVLMSAALVFFVYYFRSITIIFDTNKILKNIRRIDRKYTEKILIENIDFVDIVPKEKVIGDISRSRRFDLYLSYTDGDSVKVNYSSLSNKDVRNVGYQIASFLNVPMRKR